MERRLKMKLLNLNLRHIIWDILSSDVISIIRITNKSKLEMALLFKNRTLI